MVFLAVYAPAVGLGFISDDFAWIAHSRVQSAADLARVLSTSLGFYRPLVGLSFAADYAVFGTHALGYGWTNLALALVDAALVAALCRALGLTRAGAWLAAAVWLLNFHGINMALLWISGRSALLLIAGALTCLLGLLRQSTVLTLIGFAAALLSKEESVALPLIAAGAIMLHLRGERTARHLAMLSTGAALLLIMYAMLRMHSGAMTPSNAPDYYRFTFAPSAVARNIVEYVDRGATFAIAAMLVGVLGLAPRGLVLRRDVLLFAAAWFIAAYLPTVTLPVRSSLYACFPSIGAAIACAHVLEASWAASEPRHQRWTLALLAVVPILCVPAYVARNHRWTDLAVFSSRVLNEVELRSAAWPDGATLVLTDDRSTRVNLNSAFGSLIGDAVALRAHRRFDVRLEPPAAATHPAPACGGCPVVRVALQSAHAVKR